MLSYPSDEVGNHLVDMDALDAAGVNPWTDVLTEEKYRELFGIVKHPFTGVDYIEYYKQLITEAGCEYFANKLRPCVVAAPVAPEHKAYALVDDNGMISFRLLSATERTLPAHSSWLSLDDANAPECLSIVLPDNETGVTGIEVQSAKSASIYNIHGQKLNAPQTGVNIIEGKKVIVK